MTEQRAEYVTEPEPTATEPVQVAATGAWKLYYDGKWLEFEHIFELSRALFYLMKAQQPTMTETYRVERVR